VSKRTPSFETRHGPVTPTKAPWVALRSSRSTCTVGIDLASQAAQTAAAVVASGRTRKVLVLEQALTDSDVRRAAG
jgi:hypothetical protein